MTESHALKPGETATYTVKGKTLTMEPVPIGKLKEVIRVLSNPDPEDISKTVVAWFGAAFDPETHDFLTPEWIQKNVSLPLYNQIVKDALAINGVGNFQNGDAPQRETRPLVESQTPPTLSDSATSITPSA